MVLAGVRHPDQPGRGRGEQQRSHRGIGGAVGHVEQARRLGLPGQAVVQGSQFRLGHGRRHPGQAVGLPVMAGGHEGSPFWSVTG